MIRDTEALILADKKHFISLQEFFYLLQISGPFDEGDPQDTILYYLEFDEFAKIGITKRDIERRFKGYNLRYKIRDSIKLAYRDALYLESRILGLIDRRYQFRDSTHPMITKGGHTECFYKIPERTFGDIIKHSVLAKVDRKQEVFISPEQLREIYDLAKYEYEELPPWQT